MNRRALTFAFALSGVLAAGCMPASSIYSPERGPQRMMLHGHQLVFDRVLGVYVVNGWPAMYFHDGTYYRYRNGTWLVAYRPGGYWRHAHYGMVPRGLARRYGGGYPDRGRRPQPDTGIDEGMPDPGNHVDPGRDDENDKGPRRDRPSDRDKDTDKKRGFERRAP